MEFANIQEKLLVRTALEESQLMFTRYMFQERERARMTLNWHHYAIARALDDVMMLRIPRLLITLPPGYTKTMFILDAIARAFGRDPMSRNILLTYNSTLSNNNSQILMDTMELPDYQSMWPVRLRSDVAAKRKWNTRHGGGVVASGVGGTITGFRAGRINQQAFTGGVWIDDPLKPADANSRLERDKVNSKMTNTIRSRLMLSSTPIVMVMQRLHDNDPAGHVLRGGTGDEWTHLNIPAKMEPQHLKRTKRYARKYPYGKPLVYPDLFRTGYTWPLRVDKAEHKKIRKGDPFTCDAQYDQEPSVIEGRFIKGRWLHYYNELPDLRGFKRVVAVADTALEKKSSNDRTVWMVFAQHTNGHAYLLDYFGTRLEVPETTTYLWKVWERFRDSETTKIPRISAFHIEKKASGHGIIQTFNRRGAVVVPIERNVDKVSRAIESIPALKVGAILLPAKKTKTRFTRNKQWSLMHDEIMAFSAEMDHAFDDFCDALFDGCDIFYNTGTRFTDVFGKRAA